LSGQNRLQKCSRHWESDANPDLHQPLPEGESGMRKISYDKTSDILLIELSEKPIDFAEEEGPIIIHFSKDEEPVLLEILDAKEFIMNSLANLIAVTKTASLMVN
jgi:uncharacterized protein YuzE